MNHLEHPIFAFLAVVLLLVLLFWRWRTCNIPTLSIIGWLLATNIIYGVNAIIWAGNVNNPLPVWCDITTKIAFGASYALPLSMLCICKHLELATSLRSVRSNGLRRTVFELAMCFGTPLVFIALHYIVQDHRFDIVENIGCKASVYTSIPAIILIWLPRLLFSVITLVYAALSLYHFIRHRLKITSHLQLFDPELTTNHYLRLVAMAVTETFFYIAFTIYSLYMNTSTGLRPWKTWADVHSKISWIYFFSTSASPEFTKSAMILWWKMPVASIILFLFVCFEGEALIKYRRCLMWFKRTVLRRDTEATPVYSPSTSSPRPLHLVDLWNKKMSEKKLSHPSSTSSSRRHQQNPKFAY